MPSQWDGTGNGPVNKGARGYGEAAGKVCGIGPRNTGPLETRGSVPTLMPPRSSKSADSSGAPRATPLTPYTKRN